VVVEEVFHRFRDVVAVDDVSLSIEAAEFMTLLGASGSGKTTLLRIIAGLTFPTSGRVYIGGSDVTALPPQRRGVGMVFQHYALFPHMSVEENVAYPLVVRRVKKGEIARRVNEALARVNLTQMKARRPSALSGGQQQRVAVARALVYEPSVILLDEPLGALDRQLRRHMQVELRDLQRQLETTCILVTHDQEEALTMSDRVAVMNHGKILQIDTPTNLYLYPCNEFVATFIGDSNLFEGTVGGHGTMLLVNGSPDFQIQLNRPTGVAGRVVVGVRHEFVRVGRAAAEIDDRSCRLSATLEDIRFLGSLVELSLRTSHGVIVTARVSMAESVHHEVGDEVSIAWRLEDQTVHVQDEGGRRDSGAD
jgi:putative spermidine/putrescine transport system ATP-binding protein